MKEFSNYLEKNNKVDPKQRPFYLNWVRKFIHFCKTNPDLENHEKQLESFLVQLGRQYEKWQVDQAQEAVRLYGYFIRPAKNEVKTPVNHSFINDWKKAGDTMVKMLRLKQRSYRTEQSYMKWLRDIYRFVKPALPEDLTNRHIKDFPQRCIKNSERCSNVSKIKRTTWVLQLAINLLLVISRKT
ncbi:MAG: phage integrase N-terminal SAM-like domain-containing protein [Proteobacteria bacterium]|nr:phage integrase N-terminal SAM-like domain-containing protein [Pseudomonadota bacterium]MBU4470187.1 phage integrase N-terminal SAM-like domain-containing protein [Pseudomonadota bacterium]MCG2750448.1 phage integrase N-terminal SAM-like domain-containing protein [Desulfobacteraceae bacterium]